MSLTWLTDWRNRARLTKNDRQRRCDLASVSVDWGAAPATKPLVFAERTLIGTGAAYLEVDGIAAAQGWQREVREWARDEGHDLMPDGERLVIWESGDHRQKSYAINVSDPPAALGFADLWLSWFRWADGLHFDYFTNLGWIAEEQGKPYAQDMALWTRWDAGLQLVTAQLHAAHMIVVGQQYHLTNATPPLNGLFLEEYPTRSGMTLAQHGRDKDALSANGRESVWCVEIRNPERYSADTVEAWTKWAKSQRMYVATGRDAAAQGSAVTEDRP